MSYKPVRKIPKDFPNTFPDQIKVNGVWIWIDLLQDALMNDEGFTKEQFDQIITCLLSPNWKEL